MSISTINTIAGNTNTSTGVGSGIDWNSMLQAVITADSAPETTMQNEQTTIQDKEADYESVISALQTVQTDAQALCNPSSLNLGSATSSDTSLLTATATSSAAAGTYNVTVDKLATATTVTSGFTDHTGLSAECDPTQLLSASANNLGQTITINGTSINVDPSSESLNDVISAINSSVSGVTAAYDSTNDVVTLTSASPIIVGSTADTSNLLDALGLTASPDTTDSSGDHVRTAVHPEGRLNTSDALSTQNLATSLDSSGTFNINGVSVSYNSADDSLNDIINRINTQVPSVLASYDSSTDSLVLASRTTGSESLSLSDTSGNFLAATGLLGSGSSNGDSNANVTLGQNAEVTISGINNGNPIYSTSNTLSDTISGVTLNLVAADTSTPVTLTVSRNVSNLESAVQTFVTDYNTAVSLISSDLTEEPTEGTIGVGQTTGLLNGDSTLTMIKDQLSAIVGQVVANCSSGTNTLGSIGISFNTADTLDGTLSFDSSTFESAFSNDFEQAYSVLFQDTAGTGSYKSTDGGAMSSFLGQLNTYLDTSNSYIGGQSEPNGTLPLAVAVLAGQYNNLTTQITSFQAQLQITQQNLAQQYVQAETSLDTMKSQASEDGFSVNV